MFYLKKKVFNLNNLALRAPSTPVLNNQLLRKALLIKSPPSFDSVNKEPDYLNACEIDQFSTDDVNNKTQFPKDYISTTNKDPFKIKNNNIYDHEDSPHDSVTVSDVCQLNNCKDDVIICKDSEVIIICNSILRDNENNIIDNDDNSESNFNDVNIVNTADIDNSLNSLLKMNNLKNADLNLNYSVPPIRNSRSNIQKVTPLQKSAHPLLELPVRVLQVIWFCVFVVGEEVKTT